MPRGIPAPLRRVLFGNPLYVLTLKGPVPESLAFAPPDPWSGDPEHAKAILDGDFRLAGIWAPLDENPWTRVPAAEPMAASLHGFAWLSDLKALGSNAARDRARFLVGAWIERHSGWSPLAWRPDVLGRRLGNWFAAADFLLGGADPQFRTAFLKACAAQACHLGRTPAGAAATAGAFHAVRGLVYAGLCLKGREKLLAAGRALLVREIERQILPDGGQYQRNPTVQVAVLRILCDLRTVLLAAKSEVPAALLGAIDRMAPMLRAQRLGDGGLGVFNGGWEEDRRLVDTVLSQAGVRGQALANAPHTGYQRLVAGQATVLTDVGGPPPRGADLEAHAGTLSFEMTAGKQRLIVNCGSYLGEEAAWRHAMRGTAAHSTLCLNETNSSEIQDDGRFGARVAQVIAVRGEGDAGQWIEAEHDGYAPNFEIRHHRRLELHLDGTALNGEDRLRGRQPATPMPFSIRFHLHPDIQASLLGGGRAVLLRPPKGKGWRFEASAGDVALAESLYMGLPSAKRRSEQIVVTGLLRGPEAVVAWSLRRIEKG